MQSFFVSTMKTDQTALCAGCFELIWRTCRKKLFLMYVAHLVWVITKTYLYYFDPFKPHFYIVKLGFTGVYIIFLISAQGEAVLTSAHNLCFEQKYEKYQHFFSENFHFLVVKISLYMYLNRRVFVMTHLKPLGRIQLQ